MAARYRPMRLPTGAVIQSGLDASPAPMSRRVLTPGAAFYRAVVVSTYVATDPESRHATDVECDVVLVRTNVPLLRVPVLQQQHGVNNLHTLWVPRPSTRTVSTPTTDVNFAGAGAPGATPAQPASAYGDLDGDHVLVSFVENDVDYPVIVRALTHEQTKRLVTGAVDSIGWEEGGPSVRGTPYRNEMYSAHYGSEQRVNAQGDVLIDTVGAFDDPVTEDASANSGQVRVRVKNSQRFTVEMDGTDVFEVWKDGSQVRIDLGEGATERIVLGDSFRTFLNDFFANIFDQHTHSSGTGTTGAPLPAFVSPVRQDMGANLLSDLAKAKK